MSMGKLLLYVKLAVLANSDSLTVLLLPEVEMNPTNKKSWNPVHLFLSYKMYYFVLYNDIDT